MQSQIAHMEILRNLIDDDIKQQRAAKLNLVATDEEVDGKLAEIKAPYTQEEFNRQLKAKSMTVDDLKREIRRGLTNEKLMNKEIFSKINITDADITEYYNGNKALFNVVQPEYHLAQIVVSTLPGRLQPTPRPPRASATWRRGRESRQIHTRLESGDDFRRPCLIAVERRSRRTRAAAETWARSRNRSFGRTASSSPRSIS